MSKNKVMTFNKLYNARPFFTYFLLFVLISISVGILYYPFLDTISFYELMDELKIDPVTISIITYLIRFLIAGFSMFIIIPNAFYQKPRNINGYKDELQLVKGYSWTITISCGLLSYLVFVLVTVGLGKFLAVFTENPFIFLQAPRNGYAGWLLPIAAINPGFFEEIGLRGVLFSTLRKDYPGWIVVIGIAVLFGLYHLENLVVGDSINLALFKVLMSSLFGLSWGYMTLKTRSVIPSIIVLYLIDATGEGIFSPNTIDQILTGQFFMGVTLLYPLISIIAIIFIFRKFNYADTALM